MSADLRELLADVVADESAAWQTLDELWLEAIAERRAA